MTRDLFTTHAKTKDNLRNALLQMSPFPQETYKNKKKEALPVISCFVTILWRNTLVRMWNASRSLQGKRRAQTDGIFFFTSPKVLALKALLRTRSWVHQGRRCDIFQIFIHPMAYWSQMLTITERRTSK